MKSTSQKVLFPFFALSAVLFTSQCSHTDSPQQQNAYKYLTADNSKRFPAQEFEEALSREVYLAGGNYHIVAFPYTLAYINSLVSEQAQKKGLSPKEKKDTVKRLKDRFVTKKTCFKFRYSVLRFNEVGQLKDWQVTFFNDSGAKADLSWESNPKRDPSFAQTSNPLDEIHEKWLGDGVACIDQKLNLTQSFGLKVKPQYVQFPFDSHGDLYWDLDNAAQKVRHRKTSI